MTKIGAGQKVIAIKKRCLIRGTVVRTKRIKAKDAEIYRYLIESDLFYEFYQGKFKKLRLKITEPELHWARAVCLYDKKFWNVLSRNWRKLVELLYELPNM